MNEVDHLMNVRPRLLMRLYSETMLYLPSEMSIPETAAEILASSLGLRLDKAREAVEHLVQVVHGGGLSKWLVSVALRAVQRTLPERGFRLKPMLTYVEILQRCGVRPHEITRPVVSVTERLERVRDYVWKALALVQEARVSEACEELWRAILNLVSAYSALLLGVVPVSHRAVESIASCIDEIMERRLPREYLLSELVGAGEVLHSRCYYECDLNNNNRVRTSFIIAASRLREAVSFLYKLLAEAHMVKITDVKLGTVLSVVVSMLRR